MRTVICHFFNEAYLLPWWLRHHTSIFDHGIMIDHGSTDGSVDIVRQLAPNWRLVRTRLMRFDAFGTDFEVMNYEQELPGWKIALNVTEFLMPALPLGHIERDLVRMGREGCSASGMVMIDHQPEIEPSYEESLVAQKTWGLDDNAELNPQQRQARGQTPAPHRNRFFHRNATGMYHPGRHASFHPDSRVRLLELMVFHFAFAPWNKHLVSRKTQILQKICPEDIKRGWGLQHQKTVDDLERDYKHILASAIDLSSIANAREAIAAARKLYK